MLIDGISRGNNNQAFQSQTNWGRLQMKPTKVEKQRQNGRGEWRKGNKKPSRKRGKRHFNFMLIDGISRGSVKNKNPILICFTGTVNCSFSPA
jgi:hypothetical protein